MNLIDFERIGRGLADLWDGITQCQWSEGFLRDVLCITGQGMLDAIPTLLTVYFLIYAALTVSALTLRLVQGQGSVFTWKEKIPVFVLSVLAFPVWPVFLSVLQQTGWAAASVPGNFALNLSGLYYLFDLFGAIWIHLLVLAVLLAMLVYPLSKALKCLGSYPGKPVVGIIWMVFDVGLGPFCVTCFLLGMHLGRWQMYLLALAAIILNHFGEKKKANPPKKKTAEIYTTP